MNEIAHGVYEDAEQAHDNLLTIGEFVVNFVNTRRLTTLPNLRIHENDNEVFAREYRYENDAEHSYHLALSAVEMAAIHYPELDTGLVAQFALVHDMPERYSSDTPSYKLSPEERASKEDAEKEALERLLKELPPHLADLLERYEQQAEPEARFVRLVDKLMPAVIHTVAIESNTEVFLGHYDITSAEQLLQGSLEKTKMLREMFPEFEFLHILRSLTSAASRRAHFPNQ